jgi:hypothetical protein
MPLENKEKLTSKHDNPWDGDPDLREIIIRGAPPPPSEEIEKNVIDLALSDQLDSAQLRVVKQFLIRIFRSSDKYEKNYALEILPYLIENGDLTPDELNYIKEHLLLQLKIYYAYKNDGVWDYLINRGMITKEEFESVKEQNKKKIKEKLLGEFVKQYDIQSQVPFSNMLEALKDLIESGEIRYDELNQIKGQIKKRLFSEYEVSQWGFPSSHIWHFLIQNHI